MVKLRHGKRGTARALVARVVVALFLLQAFAVFGGAGAGRSTSDAGASLATMGGDFCRPATHDGQQPVAPGGHGHHCVLCPAHCDEAPAAEAGTRIGRMFGPRPASVSAWSVASDPIVFAHGWAGSWSSRAPPRLA